MDDLEEHLLKEVKRRIFEESSPRLTKCISLLTEGELWQRPNNHSNSVGNLVLHLCGNINQWIVSALGAQPDERQRDNEFSADSVLPAKELMAQFDNIIKRAQEVVAQLNSESLNRSYDVQGFHETGVGILIHVTEHFSYHVGQISYAVKMIKDIDLAYYDHDLGKTNP
jgi:uncharacterized damage-inducible protein DinB